MHQIHSEDGYIFLQLPSEPFSVLPETLTAGGHALRKKKEFHITIVHAASLPEAELHEVATAYLAEHPIAFESFTDDLRLAAERGRTSIAARCKVRNLEGFFDAIEARFGVHLPLQPAHVSLYIDADRGVGIDSEEEWQSHGRVDPPGLMAVLRTLETDLQAAP